MPYRYNAITGELDIVDTVTASGYIKQIDTDAGSVLPVADIINILGGTGIDTAGAGSTVTINLSGTTATQYTTDLGAAIPAANNLNILGDATQGISSSGAGNTVTLTNSDATETQKGVSELATDAEAIAGVDTVRTIVPSSMQAKLGGQTLHGIAVGNGAASPFNYVSAGTTGELLVASTGSDPTWGNTSYGDFSFTNLATPTTPRMLAVINLVTDATSTADLRLSTPPLGGDSMVSWEVQGTHYFAAGIDNSVAGDPWKLSNSSAPSSGTAALAVDATTAAVTFADSYEFPVADGNANEVLATDGAGNVDWAAAFAPITKYVVDADGTGDYTTIQAAMIAANAAGIDATVVVRPGIYTEGLTFYDGINLQGNINENTVIIGSHVTLGSISFSVQNLTLDGGVDDIFRQLGAAVVNIILENCILKVSQNGKYIADMSDVTGSFQIKNCTDITDITTVSSLFNFKGDTLILNSQINASVNLFNSTSFSFTNSTIYNAMTFNGSTPFIIHNSQLLDDKINTAGTASGIISDTIFSMESGNKAIDHQSTGTVTLSNVTIDSDTSPCIDDSAATGGTIIFGEVVFLDNSDIAATIVQDLTPILKTGEIHAENIQNMDCSGIEAWGGAGNYYSLAATDFTLLRAGTGYVRGKLVSWAGGQATGALAIENTHFIYVDEDGIIGTTTTRSFALFRDNIVLFEVFVDPNSVVTVVREDHPYNFSTAVSDWAHDTIGTVIANITQGANITLNGTKGIQINGADELEDHGLETDIPDSAAAAVNFTFVFTDAAGKWEIDSTANTFASEYNNGGVVAALGANKYGIFRLYVSKDDLNSSTPVYYAVLDSSQYNNLVAAQTAVAAGTPPRQSNELAQLEMAQLGLVIKEESSDTIVDVIIEKDVGGGSTSLVSPGVASLVATDTTNFDGWLSASDTTVQAALETLDEVAVTWSVETGAAVALAVNKGYITNRGGGITYTLPTTAAVGSIIRVVGGLAGLWAIAQNAGESIVYGAFTTTVGVGGSLVATNIGDTVELLCIVADTGWMVASGPQGNIDVN